MSGARRLKAAADGPFDVLVIGGGIVGAGVARDAAMRGLRTLLVEKADFASGTSSRSSRLFHGGLRYLAQGHIQLVREASREKMRLSRIAAHLCQPLPFLFPTWKGGLPRWKLSIGVRLYDLLCGGHNLGSSATYSPEEMLARAPGLRSGGLRGGTCHFDALTNDGRLVIDTLLSAQSAGAAVLNYAPFVSAALSSGEWRCVVRDELAGESAEIRAKAVVNAAGAWASLLPQSGIRLRLTKGVHLVIDRKHLPVNDALVLSEGNRILFVIPWGERLILGTTDTDYSGDPDDVATEAADAEYILGVVNGAFPGAAIGCNDLIASWAGVRPLIAPRHEEAGAPSDISRSHVIRMSEPGWLDVAGGKLTTYRLMAEQVVDRIGRQLGRRLSRSQTAEIPLDAPRHSGVLPPAVGADVVASCCADEWAVHLDDVLLRRTSWRFYHRDHAQIAERTARWMAQALGWSAETMAAELERYRQIEQAGGRAWLAGCGTALEGKL